MSIKTSTRHDQNDDEIDPILDQFIRLLAQAAVRRDRRAAQRERENAQKGTTETD